MPEAAIPKLDPHAVGLDEDLEDGCVGVPSLFPSLLSFPSSKRSATRLGLARASPPRDGSDGYNPGLRSPEVSLAGATVYSGL